MPGEKRGKIKSQVEMIRVVEIPYTEINKVLLTGMLPRPKGRKILRKRKTKIPKLKEIRNRARAEEGNMNGWFSHETKRPIRPGDLCEICLLFWSVIILT